MAERVAAEQPPGGEQDAARRAEAADRLGSVRGATRLVAAAAWKPWRDPATIGADQCQEKPFHVERPLPVVAASTSSMLSRTPFAPSRSISSPLSGRAARTKSWWAGKRSARPQNPSRRAPLALLRSTAPPPLRLT